MQRADDVNDQNCCQTRRGETPEQSRGSAWEYARIRPAQNGGDALACMKNAAETGPAAQRAQRYRADEESTAGGCWMAGNRRRIQHRDDREERLAVRTGQAASGGDVPDAVELELM